MTTAGTPNATEAIQEWEVSRTRENPLNPRGPVGERDVVDLTASVRENGVLQPLTVRPDGTVVMGHRRRMAAICAGRPTVPVIVRDYSESEQLKIMMIENVQRQDLNPRQEARGYQAMRERGMNNMDIARAIGFPASTISHRLMILRLPERVQEMFERNELPVTLPPLLVKVENVDRQIRLAMLVGSQRLTVPKLKQMIETEVEQAAAAAGGAGDEGSGASPRKRGPNRELKVDHIARRQTKNDPTRAEASAILAESPGRTLSFEVVRAVLDGVCCSCGMESLPAICQSCPLPAFIKALNQKAGEWEAAPAANQKPASAAA